MLAVCGGVQTRYGRTSPVSDAFRLAGRRARVTIDADLPYIVVTRPARFRPRVDDPPVRKPAKNSQENPPSSKEPLSGSRPFRSQVWIEH